ncbi:hypothetical protein M2440_001411 [Methylorubrum extorquens]|nr:hypothetical protein [Methylorubrum extorquens]
MAKRTTPHTLLSASFPEGVHGQLGIIEGEVPAVALDHHAFDRHFTVDGCHLDTAVARV